MDDDDDLRALEDAAAQFVAVVSRSSERFFEAPDRVFPECAEATQLAGRIARISLDDWGQIRNYYRMAFVYVAIVAGANDVVARATPRDVRTCILKIAAACQNVDAFAHVVRIAHVDPLVEFVETAATKYVCDPVLRLFVEAYGRYWRESCMYPRDNHLLEAALLYGNARLAAMFPAPFSEEMVSRACGSGSLECVLVAERASPEVFAREAPRLYERAVRATSKESRNLREGFATSHGCEVDCAKAVDYLASRLPGCQPRV